MKRKLIKSFCGVFGLAAVTSGAQAGSITDVSVINASGWGTCAVPQQAVCNSETDANRYLSECVTHYDKWLGELWCTSSTCHSWSVHSMFSKVVEISGNSLKTSRGGGVSTWKNKTDIKYEYKNKKFYPPNSISVGDNVLYQNDIVREYPVEETICAWYKYCNHDGGTNGRALPSADAKAFQQLCRFDERMLAANGFMGCVMSQKNLASMCNSGTIVFGKSQIGPYGGQDVKPLVVSLSSYNQVLYLKGNSWKTIPFVYRVTENTVLEFDFYSSIKGELHGIGFDTEPNGLSMNWLFKVHGTQKSGIEDFNNYAGGWKHYRIRVGDYFTGNMKYLYFANDHDVTSPNANSYFKNVRVYED